MSNASVAMTKLLLVYTSTHSHVNALKIAHALVEGKLVACAQISKIESIYMWDGDVQQQLEYRLLLKTTEQRYAYVESTIRALHEYELPAIYAVEVKQAFEAYAGWVTEVCS